MIQLIPQSWLTPFGMRQPSPRLVAYYFKNLSMVGILFSTVYTVADKFNEGRARYSFALEIERGIPLVEWTVWIYFSVVLLLVIAPFAIKAKDIRPMSHLLGGLIIISGLLFVLLPAKVHWSRPDTVDSWALRLLYEYDSPVNTLPSLHVVFATILTLFIARRASPVRPALWIWWMLICLSTLLVHQHHLLDIFLAWGLSYYGWRIWNGHKRSCS